MSNSKISTGPNGRARNEIIGQTAAGLPNDSGRPVAVDKDEIRRVARKLKGEAPDNQEKGK
jgi:hypothetical protein